MEEKSTKRYLSLRKSFATLKLSKGANPEAPFVLSATAQTFNLTFDLAWKVMKDIILEDFGITDFATGSPKETIRTAHSVGLIENDIWLSMLHVRNTLIHDYDGEVAQKYFYHMIQDFSDELNQFIEKAGQYYPNI